MASTACIPPAPAPQDAVGLRDRARGALLGLAVGDALGAPAENMKPSEIRARWGRITGYVADRPAGTDDTEYAIFSGLLLARHGGALTQAHVEAAWHEWIADREEGPFRGAGFSERGTLENLRRGLAAPISAQHRHAWSDGLAMRAAPHGVFAAGRPAEAARLAAIDGSVSHEGEGIYGGQAVAAGVAAAMAGASTVAVVASALAVVPDDSWTARCLRRALTAAHRGERAVRSAVVIGGYPWTDLAPEAVALAFGAYAAADGDFADSVLTAVNMGRDADTTAAVAGALAGATRGVHAIPADWAGAIGPARGSCLPTMAGHHVLEVADLLTRSSRPAPPASERVRGTTKRSPRNPDRSPPDPERTPPTTETAPPDTEPAPRTPTRVASDQDRVPPGTHPLPRAAGPASSTEAETAAAAAAAAAADADAERAPRNTGRVPRGAPWVPGAAGRAPAEVAEPPVRVTRGPGAAARPVPGRPPADTDPGGGRPPSAPAAHAPAPDAHAAEVAP
ncbi:ADP-ribosylglycohydrolase family protein [Streptomyces rubrogriseus]|uniref:ADP-ribosylglycohydrolase family protein n=1 Tax=Streptomyces rubrogriseus TaxID=194673 RepID=UPI000D5979E9|nr:ADP-ribosylglycohydrolase family protein [Streptomyces rubrogriseus]